MRRTRKWLEKERGRNLEAQEAQLLECNLALDLKWDLEAMLERALDSPGGGLISANLKPVAAAAAWARQGT